MADSRQQAPFIKLLVPFTGPICGGLCNGMMVILSGTVVQDCDRFRINFESVSCQNPQNDIAFHFSTRFEEGGYVLSNTFENQSWQKEEKKYEIPFLKGHPFQIHVLVEHDLFMVFVNGKQFVEYKHRMPLLKVNAIGVAGGMELSAISFQKTAPGVMFLPKSHQPQPYSMPHRTSMAGGLYPSKSVIITGTVLPNADRFHVDLKQDEDVAFHLNPRFSSQIIVRNTRLNQYWGSEERGLPSGMPFVRGQDFAIWILCEAHCFKVAVNGQYQFDYNHRVSNLQRINLLEIGGDVLLTCVQV